MSKKEYNTNHLPIMYASIQIALKRFASNQGIKYADLIILGSCYYFHNRRGFFTSREIREFNQMPDQKAFYTRIKLLENNGYISSEKKRQTNIYMCTYKGIKLVSKYIQESNRLIDSF